MPYTAGSQGADANCAKTFVEGALHTAITGGGFTYVEERTSAAITARVYKSPAASNFFGSDWFLVIYRSSDSSSGIGFAVCEVYDSAAHVCKNYAPATNSLTPTAQYAVNDATGKAPTDASGTGLACPGVQISTVGFQFWLSVTPNRVVVATRSSSNDYMVYAGLYDDFLPLATSPFPLVVTAPSTNTGSGWCTREPGQTASVAGNFRIYFAGGAFQWTASLNGDVYTGKRLLSRFLITSERSGLRGLLRDVWWSSFSGVNGDTVSATIDGVSRTLVQMKYVAGAPTVSTPFVDTAI